jgi:hypothetical protein
MYVRHDRIAAAVVATLPYTDRFLIPHNIQAWRHMFEDGQAKSTIDMLIEKETLLVHSQTRPPSNRMGIYHY